MSDPIRHRWRDIPAPGRRDGPSDPEESPLESAAGSLFRAAPPPIPRSPQAASSLFAELRGRNRPWGGLWLQRFIGVRRLAVALSAFMSINLAMAVTIQPVRAWWSRVLLIELEPQHQQRVGHLSRSHAPPVAPTATAPTIGAQPVFQQQTGEPATGAVLPAPTALPVVAAAAPSHARNRIGAPLALRAQAAEPVAPIPGAVSAAAHVPAVSPGSEPLASESELLSGALTALGQGQPSRALVGLAVYQQKFPHGSLAYEARLAEVKAQLANGQPALALSALEKAAAMPGFEALPRSSELVLMRAELLARAHGCGEALPIFEHLASSSGDGLELEPALAERALYGKAGCLSSEGNREGSQRTLRAYLHRFPDGRFAQAARSALGAESP